MLILCIHAFPHHFIHSYHDRHQATHYPLYYSEQQDQGRESSYWTVPGSRTGGGSQEYATWADHELTGPSSSHFPFILERHPQHQGPGDYQPHEARDREWTAAQRAGREYDRGFLREGWQRRWEPCNPARYNRDISTKKHDSSYRELEAWAARYSHSLPRRRRIEAELRGASQGLLETSRASERDSRSGIDPRIAALQQVIHSANIRESGLWDRVGKQQTQNYYPPQPPVTDTSNVLSMKEKSSYQRRMFGQPPGYIAPPPYNTPQKSSPVLHHSDTSWEQEGKRQSYWSHPTLRKQDIIVDQRKREKEDFTKPDVDQHTFPDLEQLKLRQETHVSQESSPVKIQKPCIQFEGMLSLQQPQVLNTDPNKKSHEEPSSKVIEGRKFRLNKKTGGMTIFCLVSRIADAAEIPSLPVCTLQTNLKNSESGGASQGQHDSGDISQGPQDSGDVSQGPQDSGDVNQTHKLADEVDCGVHTTIGQSETSRSINIKAQQMEGPNCEEREMLEENENVNLLNKAETDVVPHEKADNGDCMFGRRVAQSVQSASVKYPLWREPSFSIKSEAESSPTGLKMNHEEGESNALPNQEASAEVHPNDTEEETMENQKDTEAEDSKCLPVVDTTCVVVKMELIQLPKKEHVHYLDSAPHSEYSPLEIQSTIFADCNQSDSQSNEDLKPDQNDEKEPLQSSEGLVTELESDAIEERATSGEEAISILCMSSFPVSERESLEERAERILGIPLSDCASEQQPVDATPPPDLSVKDEEVEPLSIRDHDIDDLAKEFPEDTTEEEQLQIHQTEDVMCLKKNDNTQEQVENECGENFARPQDKLSTLSEDNDTDLQLETAITTSPGTEMTDEDLNLKSDSEEGKAQQSQTGTPPVENNSSSEHPSQCSSPPTDLSSVVSPPVDSEASTVPLTPSSPDPTSLLYISGSDTEDGPDPELMALHSPESLGPYLITSPLPQSPSQQMPSPLPPESPPHSAPLEPSGSPPHMDDSSTPPSLDLINQNAESSCIEGQDEEGEISQLAHNEMNDSLADLASNMTEEMVSQQHFESGKPADVPCMTQINFALEDQTIEATKAPTDHDMGQTLKIPADTEVSTWHQELISVQEEEVVCVNYGFMTEEQLEKKLEDPTEPIQTLEKAKDNIEGEGLQQQSESSTSQQQQPKEVDAGSPGLSEQTICEENITDAQTEDSSYQHCENGQEEDASCLTEINATKEPSQKEANKDLTISVEQTTSTENASESQTHPEPQTETLNSAPPSHLEVPSSLPLPHNPDKEYVSLLSMDSVLSTLNTVDAAATPVLSPLYLLPCEESFELLSSSDSPLKEKTQYPKSLWDAVNRIRKHTAPDSENEEEELGELWDPESIGVDLACPDVVQEMDFERSVSDDVGQQDVSAEGSLDSMEVGQIQQDTCRAACAHAKEDAASCSSASSHGSGDTAVVPDEEKTENVPSDTGTGNQKVNEEFQMGEGKQCCPGEGEDETAAEEEDDNGGHK